MIIEKNFYWIKFKLESPLSVGNGVEELTKHDIIRDSEGKPFIPATSIAGAFIHYLEKEKRKVVIPEKNNEKILSPFFISDATIVSDYRTSIRDGIKVGEDKITVTGNKYDLEILENSTEFNFRIEVVARDNDNPEEMNKLINNLIFNLNSGNILLGLKSRRGFGKVSILEVLHKKFKKENLKELIKFNKYNKDQYEKYEDNNWNVEPEDTPIDTIEIKLKQIGGLSIRSYIAKAGEINFEHIKSNNIPVIPGTSWNGLIKKQLNYYNDFFYRTKGFYYNLDNWFGYIDKNKALASRVIIEESHIENSKEITLTRNRINRFISGAMNTGLFTEKACFNGTTSLKIKLKKKIEVENQILDNDYVLGLISLVVKDIDNGLIALGGQTSIGRGIFKVEGFKINNIESTPELYIHNLYNAMDKMRGDKVGK